MGRRKIVVLALIVLALASVAQVASAQDCRVVRIHGGITLGDSAYQVEPETLIVDKGTCVIWFNRAATAEVKIVFEDGKKCASVSDAPMGFSLDHGQCYVTTWLPFGGTSSLRFQEAGAYDYVVQISGGEADKGRTVGSGKIVVR